MLKYLWLLQTWRINHRRCFRYNFGISFRHEVQKCLLKTSKNRHDFQCLNRFSDSFYLESLRFCFSDSIFVLIRYFTDCVTASKESSSGKFIIPKEKSSVYNLFLFQESTKWRFKILIAKRISSKRIFLFA